MGEIVAQSDDQCCGFCDKCGRAPLCWIERDATRTAKSGLVGWAAMEAAYHRLEDADDAKKIDTQRIDAERIDAEKISV